MKFEKQNTQSDNAKYRLIKRLSKAGFAASRTAQATKGTLNKRNASNPGKVFTHPVKTRPRLTLHPFAQKNRCCSLTRRKIVDKKKTNKISAFFC